jgi:hypothetical protein
MSNTCPATYANDAWYDLLDHDTCRRFVCALDYFFSGGRGSLEGKENAEILVSDESPGGDEIRDMIKLVAKKTIDKDEEIIICYGEGYWSADEVISLLCTSPKCIL